MKQLIALSILLASLNSYAVGNDRCDARIKANLKEIVNTSVNQQSEPAILFRSTSAVNELSIYVIESLSADKKQASFMSVMVQNEACKVLGTTDEDGGILNNDDWTIVL